MKEVVISILQVFAKLILQKYKPTIVAITGSVGKTSTKEAIYAVLASKFSVRATPRNYNNELGVPLTIIGAGLSPERERAKSLFLGKSPFRWCRVFCRALWQIIMPARYPAILVLEMGADRPKDIQKLVKLAPPKIGVVTAIAPVHTEFFGDVEKVAREKRRLVEAVPKQGTVVLNIDDEMVREFAKHAKSTVVGYGIESNEAEVRAVEVHDDIEIGGSRTSDASEVRLPDIELGSIHFKIITDGSAVPVHLPSVLGHAHVYAALAACAVGRAFGMHMVEISRALLNYAPPPGRMRIIAGIKNTVIIDDTYNASPRATVAALETLGGLSPFSKSGLSPVRYAVLGDMLELGPYTESGHREVGRVAAQNADVVIGVGVSAQWLVDEANKTRLNLPSAEGNFVGHLHTHDEAEHFLQERIRPGDVILIKGSQSMRMEKLVKGLMAEPLRADELLCRQEKEWLTRQH